MSGAVVLWSRALVTQALATAQEAPAARSTPLRDGLALALALLPLGCVAASRDLDWLDGPELALAAVTFGVAHPPGAPLHTLFAGTLSRVLPAGFGVALASVLPWCLAAVPATVLAELACPAEGRRRARVARALALTAALLWPAVFETGTRVEVYALASLGALSALALAALGRPLAAGVALGLTGCSNPAFALAAGLGVAVVVGGNLGVRGLARTFLGGLLGLLPYLQLPWAARSDAHFAWGAPDTPGRFLAVLLAKDYQRNVGLTTGHVATSVGRLAGHVAAAAGALAVGVAGLALGRRRAPWLAVGAGLLGAAQLVLLIGNKPLPHNPDLQGYLVPVALLAGIGFAALSARAALDRGARVSLGVALVVSAALAQDVPWLRAHARGIHFPRRLADAAFAEAPRGAIVLLESDGLGVPALYRQEAEAARPDLVLVPVGLASSGWYWARLRARHPSLRVVLAGRDRYERLGRFLDANPSRPVVSERSALLNRLQRPACEGAFLALQAERCEPFDVRARLRLLEAAGRETEGDWIGERALASQAWSLAEESGQRGSLGLAAATLAVSLPAMAPAARALPLGARGPWPAFLQSELDILTSPTYTLYGLGHLLASLGDPRGRLLVRAAEARGEPAARAWLARNPPGSAP
ncbi:MAG: DUF2723 domain-containing protein [Deltaproteobacteria bacterium]|nr:DUF2723 domain-containing protein [Deltaproteobacteria bacterium]